MKTIRLTASGLTDVGRRRAHNEDAWIVSDSSGPVGIKDGEISSWPVHDKGVLLAVSDGMGGAAAGEVASALVVQTLGRELDAGDWAEEKTSAIRVAVEHANREVFQAAAEESKRGMGATLTAVYVQGQTAHIAEVGDSRAYLIRGNEIRQITRDQSYVQMLIDAGALTPDEARTFPMRNVILQAMGQKENVSVEIGRLELRRHDRLLLCSDGLHGKLGDEELRDIVLGDGSLDECCKRMVALANERGGEDNITVVLATVDGDGLTRHESAESITSTLKIVRSYEGNAPAAPQTPGAPAGGEGSTVMEAAAAEPAAAPEAPEAAPAPTSPTPAAAGAEPAASRPLLAVLGVVLGIAFGVVLLFLLRRH